MATPKSPPRERQLGQALAQLIAASRAETLAPLPAERCHPWRARAARWRRWTSRRIAAPLRARRADVSVCWWVTLCLLQGQLCFEMGAQVLGTWTTPAYPGQGNGPTQVHLRNIVVMFAIAAAASALARLLTRRAMRPLAAGAALMTSSVYLVLRPGWGSGRFTDVGPHVDLSFGSWGVLFLLVIAAGVCVLFVMAAFTSAHAENIGWVEEEESADAD